MLQLIIDYLTNQKALLVKMPVLFTTTLALGYVLGWTTKNWLQKNRLNTLEERLKLRDDHIRRQEETINARNSEFLRVKQELERCSNFLVLNEFKRSGQGLFSSEIHHVSLPVRDLEESVEFYEEILNLERVRRPKIIDQDPSLKGVWFQLINGQQLHLFDNPDGTFRGENFDFRDCHLALRTSDLPEVCRYLNQKKVRVIESTVYMSRYPNIYLTDPDNHIIEINGGVKG